MAHAAAIVADLKPEVGLAAELGAVFPQRFNVGCAGKAPTNRNDKNRIHPELQRFTIRDGITARQSSHAYLVSQKMRWKVALINSFPASPIALLGVRKGSPLSRL